MAGEQAEPPAGLAPAPDQALTERLSREMAAQLAATSPAPDHPRIPAPPSAWQALGGGRSNLCWRIPAPGGDMVLKLYRVQNAGPVFPNDPGAEASCLQHLQGHHLAPALLARWRGMDGPCLLYRHLNGPLWQGDVAKVARLLRQLHALPVPAALGALRHLPDGSAALRAEIAAQAGASARAVPEGLPTRDVPPLGRRCLVHGDPVPGNLVEGAGGLRLIDWQCPGLGDPCLDLSIFLSPAMQYLYRGKLLTASERAAFLAAYDDPEITARLQALQPFLSARIIAHCEARAARGSATDATAARLERHGG